MKILISGCDGQVGWELQRSMSVLGEVFALNRQQLDLASSGAAATAVTRIGPDVIVNAAAYTAVDKAESEVDVAMQINGAAVGELARTARDINALLIHYSTDYVFDGTKKTAYTEVDAAAPLNAYGRSKLAGEQAILHEGGDWLTLRTTWVYGSRGKNFLRTILRLAAEREELSIVGDQQGAPTSARMIADATAHIVSQAMRERRSAAFESGLFNLTAAGATTWHGFAQAIIEAARLHSPSEIVTKRILSIATSEYPTPARRPLNSLLDNSKLMKRFDLHQLDWRDALNNVLGDLFSAAALP
ncbi:dTDP-4-dehydrorhamnose reductase [Burkholderia sp. SIMBA_043]|uniref:dTDP-4-dehydrorhamnose reductase n=2 Tax=Burkholderiaceae TaxID=119060 RepID=UPI0005D84D9F|nr:dTDP-4-dehydrorhamnose reductase [Burkholderia vietnamiensis]AJY06261.1 dTDP-4-dehydrorhamnose reductase [Burkholderia vietnamiensis LMG 10929]AVR15357.1 dTDP-4-dehydrorhamnose reductase [Burkholderia vietnamiensis]MBH9647667.1 dTDP-4-dehydrorhamnose reductase [Burkholderia vietnamiensis]MDN8045311.1 dTDP-4-dehydrorhamnose reductase [Burkholderia vietnamiensis]UBI26634.1 dTDP-4-dehydrorhamnose reductase [Burkholderia vietnamiensis]